MFKLTGLCAVKSLILPGQADSSIVFVKVCPQALMYRHQLSGNGLKTRAKQDAFSSKV